MNPYRSPIFPPAGNCDHNSASCPICRWQEAWKFAWPLAPLLLLLDGLWLLLWWSVLRHAEVEE